MAEGEGDVLPDLARLPREGHHRHLLCQRRCDVGAGGTFSDRPASPRPFSFFAAPRLRVNLIPLPHRSRSGFRTGSAPSPASPRLRANQPPRPCIPPRDAGKRAPERTSHKQAMGLRRSS